MSGGMPMPGGWTMSMAWMRMSGQSWFAAAASFMGMWVVMMVAMMLPALVPMLSGYRRSRHDLSPHDVDWSTTLVGLGYFFVWTAWGVLVYPLGVTLAATVMSWPVLAHDMPIAAGLVLLTAGALQLSGWKTRQLQHCRNTIGCCALSSDGRRPFRFGVHLGTHCSRCCSGFMLILFVGGVMDLRVMALVAAAINVERLAPKPARAARIVGAVILTAGVVILLRAVAARAG